VTFAGLSTVRSGKSACWRTSSAPFACRKRSCTRIGKLPLATFSNCERFCCLV